MTDPTSRPISREEKAAATVALSDFRKSNEFTALRKDVSELLERKLSALASCNTTDELARVHARLTEEIKNPEFAGKAGVSGRLLLTRMMEAYLESIKNPKHFLSR